MNSPVINKFDSENAAALCAASAAAYLNSAEVDFVVSRMTDTHVRITDDGSDLIVAFRGTADVRNWLTDLDCGWGLENGFHVHRGFARALDSVEAEVRAEIVARGGEGRRIWLTGHSLGGALAMLFAWRIWNGSSEGAAVKERSVEKAASSPPQVCGGEGVETKQQEVGTDQPAKRAARVLCRLRAVRGLYFPKQLPKRSPRRGDPTWEGEDVFPGLAGVYTFGQPRVGDSTFRDCYNFSGLMGRTFRVVHADDIVPRVPWLLGAYRHAGHEVFCGKAESGVGTIHEMPALRARLKAEIWGTERAASGDAAYMVDADFFDKLPWDVRNACRELCHGKVALLADHHVSTYLDLFPTVSIQPVQRLCL